MRAERIAIRQFRNLRDVDLSPGAHFNVVFGDNGQGKSSLLEALYYLGSLGSFRGSKTEDLIETGCDASQLQLRFAHGSQTLPREARIRLHRHAGRQVTLDGKRPRSSAAYHAALPMVLFHPGDLALASGPPDGRRRFLDRMLEQIDPTYVSTLNAYTRALKSRNHLLRRRPDARVAIAAYDELLASSGAIVGQTRLRLVEQLSPRAVTSFSDVTGQSGLAEIRYESRVSPEVDALRNALASSIDKDVQRGFTAHGPHSDDMRLFLRGEAAKHHGSQGQHRALVLALKIAEMSVLQDATGEPPILLLDDVSSELDRSRNRSFFTLLGRTGAQVFLTTTHPEFILLDHDRVDYRVERGVFTVN